jgi:hypothetical protein
MIYDPEDGGDTFFRNIGSHMDYTGAKSQTSTEAVKSCRERFGRCIQYANIARLGGGGGGGVTVQEVLK